MKTKDEIRKETPLSVTTHDNPIFEIIQENNALTYTKTSAQAKVSIKGITNIPKGAKLRLLACKQDELDSIYQWGDGFDFVAINNSFTKFVKGNLGEVYDGTFVSPDYQN